MRLRWGGIKCSKAECWYKVLPRVRAAERNAVDLAPRGGSGTWAWGLRGASCGGSTGVMMGSLMLCQINALNARPPVHFVRRARLMAFDSAAGMDVQARFVASHTLETHVSARHRAVAHVARARGGCGRTCCCGVWARGLRSAGGAAFKLPAWFTFTGMARTCSSTRADITTVQRLDSHVFAPLGARSPTEIVEALR